MSCQQLEETGQRAYENYLFQLSVLNYFKKNMGNWSNQLWHISGNRKIGDC